MRRSTRVPACAAVVWMLALIVVVGVAGCEREQRAIEQDLPAARAEKARSDAQAIAQAVKVYATTFGKLPESLAALTTVATVDGITGGPFLAAIPTAPAGWSPYEYERRDDGAFTVRSRSTEGVAVAAP